MTVEFVGAGFRLNMLQFENQMPYLGVPAAIPGRIEAEHFDIGGPMIAYYDTSAANGYGAFRPDEAVDVMPINDNGPGFAVHADAGEWLEYTAAIQPGVYTIIVRSASPFTEQGLTLSRGLQELAAFTLPNTGGWINWQNTALADVYLPGGDDQILRFTLLNSSSLIDYIEFVRHTINPADMTENEIGRAHV